MKKLLKVPLLCAVALLIALSTGCSKKVPQEALEDPMSVTAVARIIDPQAAPYVSGGWGHTLDQALVFGTAQAPYDYLKLEYAMLERRNAAMYAEKYGDDVIIARHRYELTHEMVEQQGKKYDVLKYTVVAIPPSTAEKVREVLAKNLPIKLRDSELAKYVEAHKFEFWFDITNVYTPAHDQAAKAMAKEMTQNKEKGKYNKARKK